MLSRDMVCQLTFILLAIGILTTGTASAGAEREAASGSPVVSGERLTKQQFDALSDDTLIEFKGRRTTKAEIRLKDAQAREMTEKFQALARQNRAEFQQRLVQLEQQRKTELETNRAKAMGAFLRLGPADSPELKAIEVEAAQLQERSRRASPAETANIERRANQLLQQLRKLENR